MILPRHDFVGPFARSALFVILASFCKSIPLVTQKRYLVPASPRRARRMRPDFLLSVFRFLFFPRPRAEGPQYDSLG